MTLGNYKFVFGYGFLKEINKRYTPKKGGDDVKLGLEMILTNIMNKDIQTLIEVLKIANKTENDIVTENQLAQFIEEADDIESLFDEVIQEMEESNFTGSKTKSFVKLVKQKQAELNKNQEDNEE